MAMGRWLRRRMAYVLISSSVLIHSMQNLLHNESPLQYVFFIDRLVRQQQHLESDILRSFQPIFRRPADKASGEVFPTVWYSSNVEITSWQQAILAKAVLVAEDPTLRRMQSGTAAAVAASRTAVRAAENEVRLLVLELCGIALCHPASPPAMVHSALGVMMYEEFFTDEYERKALKGLVERYRQVHAWPVQKLVEMFS